MNGMVPPPFFSMVAYLLDGWGRSRVGKRVGCLAAHPHPSSPPLFVFSEIRGMEIFTVPAEWRSHLRDGPAKNRREAC